MRTGEVLEIPIAHGEGNYFTDPDTLKRLEDNQQVCFATAIGWEILLMKRIPMVAQ